MHLLVEAGACQLCEAGGIVRVGLVRLHCLEALVGLAGIDAHYRDTQFTQAKADRRRHAARFYHRPLEWAVSLEHHGDRLRRAFHFLRHELPTIFVNDADLRVSIDRSNPA